MADNLSEELQQKLKACKSADELDALAKEAGIELTDEILQVVAGGRGDERCSRWDDCKHYCQFYDTVRDAGCTWVTLPRDGGALDCEFYIN